MCFESCWINIAFSPAMHHDTSGAKALLRWKGTTLHKVSRTAKLQMHSLFQEKSFPDALWQLQAHPPLDLYGMAAGDSRFSVHFQLKGNIVRHDIAEKHQRCMCTCLAES